MEKKRIAIFGGAFNPCTLAHKNVVDVILEKDIVDEIWVIPTYKHIYGKEMVEFKTRIEMLNSLFFHCEKVSVLDVDKVFSKVSSYNHSMIELMNNIRMFDDHEYYIVVGEDNAKTIEKWSNSEKLLDENSFIVVSRTTDDSTSDWYKKEPNHYLEIDNLDISSTIVRNNIKNGDSIENLVSYEVKRIIEKKELY